MTSRSVLHTDHLRAAPSYVLCLHDKSSRNGRLLHGRLGGGRASGYLGERERQRRARAAVTRRGAAVGGGPLGVKPERTRIYACAYMSTQKAAKGNYSLLSSGSLPLVVVTRHHP